MAQTAGIAGALARLASPFAGPTRKSGVQSWPHKGKIADPNLENRARRAAQARFGPRSFLCGSARPPQEEGEGPRGRGRGRGGEGCRVLLFKVVVLFDGLGDIPGARHALISMRR